MVDIILSTKDQFQKLEKWEKYELLEYLEKLNRNGDVRVKVKCCQTFNSFIYNGIDVIKCGYDDCPDQSYYSPLELLNIFDGF